MNKKLDFVGLENKVLNCGQRYIPRFFKTPSSVMWRMAYCGKGVVYAENRYASDIEDNKSLIVFGYIVKETMHDKTFKLPVEVRNAIKALHATDRKKAVDKAEAVIYNWFDSVCTEDVSLYNYKPFDPVVYDKPYMENLLSEETITTHLLGSLYSKRFGAFALADGHVAEVGDKRFDDNYWSFKNPAPNIDIREQKINNFLLLCDGDFTVNGETVTGDSWSVDFSDISKAIVTTDETDELAIKKIVLKAAMALDMRGATDTVNAPLDLTKCCRDFEIAAYMCDRFYYECVKQNPDSIIIHDEVEIEVVNGSVEKSVEDTVEETVAENEVGMTITLSAEGARNGEYDLGKMFGITFNGTAPNRDFLKNVSITKQHLALCNKVIQSCYRIKKREEQGITDVGQLIGADFINVNFIGEPGTGKSFGLKIVSAILGVPLYIETFSGDSDTDKFQGTNSISKGTPTFEWTAVPTAHKEGGFCALEEVNQMRPDKTMAMSQALVDPFLLKVDNTMDVYRNPYTFYVNLFNVGTEGSKPFNEAYINRFGYTYDFCEDTQETEKKQLRLMLGYEVDNGDEVDEVTFTPHALTDADFNTAVTLKNRVIDYLTGDTVARDEEAKTISKRQCKEFLVEVQNGLDHKTAAIGTFVNTIKCVDRDLAQEIMDNVINVYPF